jgi:hypothetical protein
LDRIFGAKGEAEHGVYHFHIPVTQQITDTRAHLTLPTVMWRAPASVDSHRSGTMVYEEKNGSGIDTPEVHRRV